MSNGSIVLVPLFCVYYGKFQKVKNNLSSVIFTGKSYIISTKEILKFEVLGIILLHVYIHKHFPKNYSSLSARAYYNGNMGKSLMLGPIEPVQYSLIPSGWLYKLIQK